MKRIRNKIAILIGVIVCLTLFIFLTLFNVVIRWKIENNAVSSIEQIVEYYDNYKEDNQSVRDYYEELGEDGLYSVEEIYVGEADKWNEEYSRYYSRKQLQIMKWCESHDVKTIQKARIGDGWYFLQEAEYTENEETEKYIDYVDVTGEYEAIRSINKLFIIAAVIIGAAGSFFGRMLGKKIEENELAQKRFFENTSHELKTPLTAIRGYAEGIETGVITDYKKTGQVIAAQSDRMSRLVEEILCMAKIEGGAMTLAKEELDISDFVQDCLMPFEGIVKSRNLDVELDIAGGQVLADPGQFEHAFTNLLTNAIKYANSRIMVSFANNELSIWNDGEYIDKDNLKHVFDRFYTGKNGNTGIGLALAKDIVELHGWKIAANLEDGGICFSIRFVG